MFIWGFIFRHSPYLFRLLPISVRRPPLLIRHPPYCASAPAVFARAFAFSRPSQYTARTMNSLIARLHGAANRPIREDEPRDPAAVLIDVCSCDTPHSGAVLSAHSDPLTLMQHMREQARYPFVTASRVGYEPKGAAVFSRRCPGQCCNSGVRQKRSRLADFIFLFGDGRLPCNAHSHLIQRLFNHSGAGYRETTI